MPEITQMIPSKYLKKEDAGPKGTDVTIAKVQLENVAPQDQAVEEKYVVYFEEFPRGMALNKTNIQLIAALTGETNSDNWPGKKIQIYNDPSVSMKGKIVGGLRVRQAS